ncbi:UNVERIFIED_CONTAM: hypothetical protein K2H54_045483, partial [Gekko kuhli]
MLRCQKQLEKTPKETLVLGSELEQSEAPVSDSSVPEDVEAEEDNLEVCSFEENGPLSEADLHNLSGINDVGAVNIDEGANVEDFSVG